MHCGGIGVLINHFSCCPVSLDVQLNKFASDNHARFVCHSLHFHPLPHTKMPKRKRSIECQDNDLKDKLQNLKHILHDHNYSQLRTFEILPEEMVLKIFKMLVEPRLMSLWGDWGLRGVGSSLRPTTTHRSVGQLDDIVKLSKVSPSFNRIARDWTLWSGYVGLNLSRIGGVENWTNFLVDRERNHHQITHLYLSSSETTINQGHISVIAANCPNLKTFNLRHVQVSSWPSQATYPNVKDFSIHARCGAVWIEKLFEGVDLNSSFPRIESFFFEATKRYPGKSGTKKKALSLPDMVRCQNLQKVYIAMIVYAGEMIHAVKFKIPAMLEHGGPFPQGLGLLELHGTICNYPRQRILDDMPNCEVVFRTAVDGCLEERLQRYKYIGR